ncbi:MAG TPA: hypothetical protein DCY13_23985 [Verrucomicrobiales bacterium]|nr:hypothetical protein [Verrucomicrobiales bacterium]
MKTEAEIEEILRQAPEPAPPPQLAGELKRTIQLPRSVNGTGVGLDLSIWRRWLPALGYAVLILGCVVVLAVQVQTGGELRQRNEELRQELVLANETADANAAAAQRAAADRIALLQLREDAAEVDRLEEKLDALNAAIARLSAEAAKLQAQLSAAPEPEPEIIAPHDFFGDANSAFNQARTKASSIACVNNLKQIGLAFRIWAQDNDGRFPPNFNSMSNELAVAKTLCCPEDKANVERALALFHSAGLPSEEEGYYRSIAAAWAQWPINGGSYEMLGANLHEDSPGIVNKIIARCRIHGHYGLGDGSVHQAPQRREGQP